ncbi:hypothetical protein TELCIR_00382 [Teladorsagia circumcincta]|uniref:Uncharacterized protein n=1 Tax=Teladorsagia circumcincta TaxID=45464 RepID=A0A2G9V6Z8_TELCI|nr:hypothetical protein TELCIR_00382 [Teladorsagia circumcincta]
MYAIISMKDSLYFLSSVIVNKAMEQGDDDQMSRYSVDGSVETVEVAGSRLCSARDNGATSCQLTEQLLPVRQHAQVVTSAMEMRNDTGSGRSFEKYSEHSKQANPIAGNGTMPGGSGNGTMSGGSGNGTTPATPGNGTIAGNGTMAGNGTISGGNGTRTQ